MAIPADPPTMALFGMLPRGAKKACMEPPSPRFRPVRRPNTSAMKPYTTKSMASGLDVPVVRGRLHDPQDVPVQILLHDALQVGAVGVADPLQALGHDLGVAAVGAEDHVLAGQRQAQADDGGFLTERQVRRALRGRSRCRRIRLCS